MAYMEGYEIDYALFHEMVAAERERLGRRLERRFDPVEDYREIKAFAACSELMTYLSNRIAEAPDGE